VNALIYEKCDDDDVLSFFINQQCRIFKPKQLRSASRLNINFNVMLSREKFMHRNNVERAVTIDISSGGCFIYADSNWCGVKEVWFVIKEIGDHTPILGEIKRYQPWGTKMGYPGLGVLFTQITDMQKQQLSRWLGA
ncbi:MAG: PilZ domain-containing protein, partial [Sedimentisphaerales bacterium]|nr:PilZ domain-containing protein [Sedimentisphaerales bacterium]